MNDPEVTMLDAPSTTGLIAHRKALEAAGAAIKLVVRLPTPLKPITDQVIRSASSVPANLAEGHGRSGRDRLQFWRIAYASANKCAWYGCFDLAPLPYRRRYRTIAQRFANIITTVPDAFSVAFRKARGPRRRSIVNPEAVAGAYRVSQRGDIKPAMPAELCKPLT